MRIYAIHQLPSTAAEPHLVLTRQGFCLPAALLAPLWLAWRRMWWEASAVLAVVLALSLWQPAGGLVAALLLAVSLFLGFEAASLHEAALRRRGYGLQAVIVASGALEAEARFRRLQAQAPPAPTNP